MYIISIIIRFSDPRCLCFTENDTLSMTSIYRFRRTVTVWYISIDNRRFNLLLIRVHCRNTKTVLFPYTRFAVGTWWQYLLSTEAVFQEKQRPYAIAAATPRNVQGVFERTCRKKKKKNVPPPQWNFRSAIKVRRIQQILLFIWLFLLSSIIIDVTSFFHTSTPCNLDVN